MLYIHQKYAILKTHPEGQKSFFQITKYIPSSDPSTLNDSYTKMMKKAVKNILYLD